MKACFLSLFAALLGVSTALAAQQVDEAIPARSFACEALGREVAYSVFIPKETPPADGWYLVLLLHGLGRNHRTLVEDPASREVILKQRLVIVFADGKNGWYLDSPVEPASRYRAMLLELLHHARQTLPVSTKPAHTGVCGWSMGGYGAMRFTQSFPQEVAAVATSIALLDFPNAALPKKQNFTVSKLFGTDEAVWAANNCMNHTEALRGKALFFITGTRAFDLQMNRHFHARLEAAGIPHTYREIEGGHTFPVVQQTVPLLLEFLTQHLK